MTQKRKPTRAEKVEASDAAAKAAAAQKAKEVIPPKPKGVKPDFTPKAVHANLKRLIDARESGRFDDLVMGMLGTYFVGIHNEKEVIEAYDFKVKSHNGRTIIEGYDGTCIPHDYIFEPSVTTADKFMRPLAPGYIGNKQFQMVCFVQEAVNPEIEIEKGVRRHRLLSLRQAKEVSQEVAESAFTLTVVGGTDMKPSKQMNDLRSVKEFAPENYGIFNFNDGEHSCHVEYASGRRGNSVTIVNLDPRHCLALIGAEVGTKLFAKCLARDVAISQSAPNHQVLTAFQAFLLASIDAAISEKQQAA